MKQQFIGIIEVKWIDVMRDRDGDVALHHTKHEYTVNLADLKS